jgi:hypothetical protein
VKPASPEACISHCRPYLPEWHYREALRLIEIYASAECIVEAEQALRIKRADVLNRAVSTAEYAEAAAWLASGLKEQGR